MGGSTNTILHLLAAAQEAEVPFDLRDIDRLSRKVPQLCKVAPNIQKYHMEDVHRAGGIFSILGELAPPAAHRRPHRAQPEHGRRHRPVGHHPDPRRSRAHLLQGRSGGHPDPDRVQPEHPLAEPGRRPRRGLHPQRRACLFQGRRAGRALRQHRSRRLRGEDRRGRRVDPRVRRQREDLRKPGRRGERHPRRRGEGRRHRDHPLRRTEGRAGHAGNALSDQLPEVQGPGQAVRPAHRRTLLRRHLGPVHRSRLPPAAPSAWCRTATRC